MRTLVIYCHPNPQSYTAAVRDVVLNRLRDAGEVRQHDLYAMGFDPVLTEAALARYETFPDNTADLRDVCADLLWADTLVFVYPTWWYGLPAMLKGWMDRVMVPEVAFLMPKGNGETIRPGLGHITKLGVFTTCGASHWLTTLVGAPGRRTLMRGLGFLLARRARKVFAAHYLMDSSTPESRAQHLDKVARQVDRLIAMRPPAAAPQRRLPEARTA